MKKWLLAVVGLAVVSAGAVAQDAKPGQEAKVAFEKKIYPYEGEVTVVAEKDEYFQILPPKNSTVWVAAKNIKREADKGTATVAEVPVRLDSRINADLLCSLKEGESVKVVGEHMGWLKIEAPAAVKYFVGKKYVHTRDIGTAPEKAPADEKKPAAAAKAPAADASDIEAKQLLANANAELKRQDALITDKKFDQVDFTSVLADYQAAKAKAQTDAMRAEVDKALERCLAVNRVWEAAKIGVENQKKLEAERLAEKLKNTPEKPAALFTGYIDTTGILFKRPGTHKLVMNGRILCFLRIKDGDEKMLGRFNSNFQKLVGVNGTVITNPEGWDGYKVVVVDELIKMEKDPE
jgi:uncharacterized protein YgiM (DUF1202 family)